MEIESKKAKAIDRLVWASMSPFKRYFVKWTRVMWNDRLKEHGDRIKAYYILQ